MQQNSNYLEELIVTAESPFKSSIINVDNMGSNMKKSPNIHEFSFNSQNQCMSDIKHADDEDSLNESALSLKVELEKDRIPKFTKVSIPNIIYDHTQPKKKDQFFHLIKTLSIKLSKLPHLVYLSNNNYPQYQLTDECIFEIKLIGEKELWKKKQMVFTILQQKIKSYRNWYKYKLEIKELNEQINREIMNIPKKEDLKKQIDFQQAQKDLKEIIELLKIKQFNSIKQQNQQDQIFKKPLKGEISYYVMNKQILKEN